MKELKNKIYATALEKSIPEIAHYLKNFILIKQKRDTNQQKIINNPGICYFWCWNQHNDTPKEKIGEKFFITSKKHKNFKKEINAECNNKQASFKSFGKDETNFKPSIQPLNTDHLYTKFKNSKINKFKPIILLQNLSHRQENMNTLIISR